MLLPLVLLFIVPNNIDHDMNMYIKEASSGWNATRQQEVTEQSNRIWTRDDESVNTNDSSLAGSSRAEQTIMPDYLQNEIATMETTSQLLEQLNGILDELDKLGGKDDGRDLPRLAGSATAVVADPSATLVFRD